MELVRWEESEAADRVGLDDQTYVILDVPVPMLRIPVSPGRNVSSLVEVAARNRLLQVRGHHAVRDGGPARLCNVADGARFSVLAV